MARHYRFFVRNTDLSEAPYLSLNEKLEQDVFFQLTKVLRAKQGDLVTFLPMFSQRQTEGSQGFHEYTFSVTGVLKHEVAFRFIEKHENTRELHFPLHLWLCVPNKPDKLEFILQKATEIGVNEVVLFESDFSQMKQPLRIPRLEKIVVEAAEQSERAVVPSIIVQGKLSKVLTQLPDHLRASIWIAMERLNDQLPATTHESCTNPFDRADSKNGLSILVGPEGGFSDDEKALFKLMKLNEFSLGKRILRMETAAILALGLAAIAKETAK